MENFFVPVILVILLFLLKFLFVNKNIFGFNNYPNFKKIISAIVIIIFSLSIFYYRNYSLNTIDVILIIFMLYGAFKDDIKWPIKK